MNNFERGKDPKESMEIGRRKDAKRVYSIEYHINNNVFPIYGVNKIFDFLKRLSKLNIPNDPIFGPQLIYIKVFNREKVLSPGSIIKNSLSENPCNEQEYIEMDKEEILSIEEFAGKTLIYMNTLFEMPSLSEIVLSGFEHLVNNERELKENEKQRKDEELNRLKAMINASLHHTSIGPQKDKDPEDLDFFNKIKKL